MGKRCAEERNELFLGAGVGEGFDVQRIDLPGLGAATGNLPQRLALIGFRLLGTAGPRSGGLGSRFRGLPEAEGGFGVDVLSRIQYGWQRSNIFWGNE